MCSVDEYAARRKCFSVLDDLQIQKALMISKTVGMLCRFRDIPKESMDQVAGRASKLIQSHIRRYSKKKNPLSVNNPNDAIGEICSRAVKLLKAGDIDDNAYIPSNGKSSKIGLHFQEEWLSNVKLMIPSEEDVIKVLPFLLTCYSSNVKRNKLDPFEYQKTIGDVPKNKDNKYVPSPGWCEIFPEYQFLCNGVDSSQNQNLDRNRRSLARYFTELRFSSCDPNISSLLGLEAKFPSYNWGWNGITMKNDNLKEERLAFLTSVKEWELYRRFAAFCDACNEYQKQYESFRFNLTLSMALFSTAWKLEQTNSGEPRYTIEDNEFILPITLEDIENDTLRSDIIEITSLRGCDRIDIHSIVSEKKDWLLRYLYDLERIIYSEPVRKDP